MKKILILCTAFWCLAAFHASAGEPKVMARHVPERFDDFVFENDLVCYRIYGRALEGNPTSPGFDIWVKLPGALVANQRYKDELENNKTYHKDWGNGKDCYKVAVSLGAGGSVPIVDGKPAYPATNWRSYEILKYTPEKVVFVLHYPEWNAGGKTFKLDKKFTLEAGSYFCKVEDTYTFGEGVEEACIAAGIYRHPDQKTIESELSLPDRYVIWEHASDQGAEPEDGMLGVAVIMPEAESVTVTDDGMHGVCTRNVKSGETLTYYFASCWSKGDIKRAGDWFKLIREFNCDTRALTLAPQYSDGMILPKGKDITVFGTGKGKVKVSLGGNRTKCRSIKGKWSATLPAMEAGGPYTMTVKCRKSTIEVNDIHVGTVLLMAGQSNMQFKLRESNTPPEEWTGNPLIRSYSLPRFQIGEPHTPADGWVVCTKEDAGNWSAIGYLAAKELQSRTGEAIGIINCYQGASIIEAWMPDGLTQKPEYKLPDELRHRDCFEPYFQMWNKPGYLYDFDIAPFAPYPVSGVVWYQGESNTGKGEYTIYPSMFADMATAWRNDFKDNGLPFIVIQIANLTGRGEGWTKFQESQESIPSILPGSAVVKSADICEDDDIHPASKGPLAVRVADAFMRLDQSSFSTAMNAL